jgi:hypothetical protein
LFYRLWGRLSFDPATPERAWMDDLKQRFGPAAVDVMQAYAHSSQVINEIVAVHLADPNMYIWPEINPGGLTDAYREVLPSDWRFVASIPEAVRNRLEGIASAKQAAPETAARFEEMARLTEEAVARAGKKLGAQNREWLSWRWSPSARIFYGASESSLRPSISAAPFKSKPATPPTAPTTTF